MESDDLLLKTKRSSWRQRHYGGGRGGGWGGEMSIRFAISFDEISNERL